MSEKWYQDAVLESSFSTNYSERKNILLTGATGFVGTYLLYELLKQTQDEIFVLVRANNQEDAFERIKGKLVAIEHWDDAMTERIHVIVGDLESKHLGMDNTLWQLLVQSIDLIIHNGSYVNLMGTYGKHYAPNVGATLEILELARTGKKKRLTYVSTSGIFGGLYKPKEFKDGFTIREDTPIPEVRSIFSYLKTKWVADQLVQQAAKKGIDAAIFRLPHVGCDNLTGYFNEGDIFWSRLKAFTKIGKMPKIDYLFYMIPVDYLAKTIVYISLKDFKGLSFYTTVSNQKVTWMSVVDAINRAGHKMEFVEADDWYAYVKQYLKETGDRDVRAMFAYAEDQFSLFRCPRMSNENYMAALPESMRTCQSIDEIVAAYYRYASSHNLWV